MSEIIWDGKRLGKTTLGGLTGYLAEHVIEGLTGLNIADGLLEAAGVVAGIARANRDILPDVIDKIRLMFGKGPAGLTRQEWDEFCRRYPEYAEIVRSYQKL